MASRGMRRRKSYVSIAVRHGTEELMFCLQSLMMNCVGSSATLPAYWLQTVRCGFKVRTMISDSTQGVGLSGQFDVFKTPLRRSLVFVRAARKFVHRLWIPACSELYSSIVRFQMVEISAVDRPHLWRIGGSMSCKLDMYHDRISISVISQ